MIDTRFYITSKPINLGELTAPLICNLPSAKFDEELINSVSGLVNSKPGQITYLESKRQKHNLDSARATACFVSENLAPLVSEKHIIPIISKTPRGHFARIASRFATPRKLAEKPGTAKIAQTAIVHNSAVIGGGAIIGDKAEIAPYAVIGPGVEIGAGSYIGAHSHIECAVIGRDCRIKAQVVIGGAGFGVTQDETGIIEIPHFGRVIIGDRVSIGSQSCVDRGQLGDTLLGDDVKIDNLVQVAHNVTVGAGTVMAGHVGVSGSCIIGKGVQLGGNVGLADHINVGDGASIAARSGVMHDVPAGEVWSGLPALPIREHMRMVSAMRRFGKRPKKNNS